MSPPTERQKGALGFAIFIVCLVWIMLSISLIVSAFTFAETLILLSCVTLLCGLSVATLAGKG